MGRFITKDVNSSANESFGFSQETLELKDSNIDLNTYNSIAELLLSHSVYISTYIQLLNKYINLIKKVSSLKNERNLLIKFVKKLRFFNNYYYFKELIYVPENIEKSEYKILNQTFSELSNNLQELQDEKQLLQQKTFEQFHDDGFKPNVSIGSILIRIVTSNTKLLELIEILNFIITNSLKNEIMSKTLNEKLLISDELNTTISHVYCIFIKFNQWIIEALKIDNSNGNLDIELLELVGKNDTNNNMHIKLSEDDELLLQEVDECVDISEFNTIIWQWCDVIRNLLKTFDNEIENALNIHSNNKSNTPNNTNTTSSGNTLTNSNTNESAPLYAEEEPQQESKTLNVPKRNISSSNHHVAGNRSISTNKRNSRYGNNNSRASSANSSFY
ncbi:hypothetical protein HANVADRAFT_51208 [Hanseniaspora valbyensis NRRL Y-1626]|uniref:RNA binding protein She2 domain-containing protein n=1 Tax=Hanseniaspora valbyensis NRRL Y-1626 TaxID=766949 RepID=A0A1B7TJ46_9ASCO|nr:hypothetical protein HANVADRAFT_51208 [Hanseniaspora valbyensis NRRL Y-1626]